MSDLEMGTWVVNKKGKVGYIVSERLMTRMRGERWFYLVAWQNDGYIPIVKPTPETTFAVVPNYPNKFAKADNDPNALALVEASPGYEPSANAPLLMKHKHTNEWTTDLWSGSVGWERYLDKMGEHHTVYIVEGT